MSEDVVVTLNAYEREFAAWLGSKRQNMAIQNGNVEARGKPKKNGWNVHIQGALGEVAFCKFVGIYCDPTVNTFKQPDVVLADGSMMIEIKTRSLYHYNLLINDKDSKKDLWFALVFGDGESAEFTIKGGLHASNARNDEWFQDPGNRNKPVYVVPNTELIPPKEFKKIILNHLGVVFQDEPTPVPPELLEWLPEREPCG